MMNPEHESEEKEVTAQDQAHINEFSRLNVKFHELEDDLKVKQEVLVNLQDSSNEVCSAYDMHVMGVSLCARTTHIGGGGVTAPPVASGCRREACVQRALP
jgi:hypothetical protein